MSNDYNVLEAENGETALSILRENSEIISVVMLDIVMPIMDGYEVLRQMHKDLILSSIPVIVVSDQSSEDSEIKALSLGANDYILKPYRPEIIKHRVANTIYLRETYSFVNSVQQDALTGVYSKDYFYLCVQETLKNHADQKYDLICCDIERFKMVNDLYETKAGDELLKYVAEIISGFVAGKGICGRIGADGFAFLIPYQEVYNPAYFEEVIEKVNQFHINLNIILRYGIYCIEDNTTPVEVMYDRSCLAKQTIKGKYGAYFACYDDTIRQKLLDEQVIVSDMREALENGEFQTYFQPKYDLRMEKSLGRKLLFDGIIRKRVFIPRSVHSDF
ncbi:response regulator [Eubacterium aggregans]|uniref:response regulator n=1 Tax=Eubacterium aggregans TaxID=81409 RepID=UPI003F3923A8